MDAQRVTRSTIRSVLIANVNSQATRAIKRTKTYTNEGHGIVASRTVDWKIWRPAIAYIGDLFCKVNKICKR